jgi:hypothetical protein
MEKGTGTRDTVLDHIERSVIRETREKLIKDKKKKKGRRGIEIPPRNIYKGNPYSLRMTLTSTPGRPLPGGTGSRAWRAGAEVS